jgi:MFS superfamily sulfate permease-like transporter
LIVGLDGSIAALVGTAVIPLAADSDQRAPLAALLALLVGCVFLGARLARLGWIADYFSRPVLIGYVHGVAVVLIIGQLGKLLGPSINAQNPLGKLVEDIKEITDLSWITLAVGLASLAANCFWAGCSPSSRVHSYRPLSPRASGMMIAADKAAVADMGPTIRWRELPRSAYKISAGAAA